MSDPSEETGCSTCERCGATDKPLPEWDPEARRRREAYLLARPCVLVAHDECSVHCNETQDRCWQIADGRSAKKSKSHGSSIMVSGFVTVCGAATSPGVLHYTLLEPSTEGYWTSERMLADVQKAIDAGEARYPGCTLVFLFDHR